MKSIPVILVSLLGITALLGSDSRPNIVLLFVDDLGYGDVSYHGFSSVPTPAMDSIAENGAYFTAGYVTAPVCGPSRAGLLTGRYQQRFGFEDNPGPYRQNEDVTIGFPESETTIGEYLKSAGYRTGFIGKHHSGKKPANNPLNHGFDYFFGFDNGASTYFLSENKRNQLMRNREVLTGEAEYLTDAFGREAVGFINRNKDKPFFLYVAFNGVHAPMEAPSQLLNKYKNETDEGRRALLAMLDSVDSNIDRILTKLKKSGLLDNTLIICLSDNGGAEDKSNFSYNGPLREIKGCMYDGGIRVPFCVQWPDRIASGQKIDDPVISVDVVPTILAAAGVEGDELDGLNLLPRLTSQHSQLPPRYLYWRFLRGYAIRDTEWKLVKPWGGRDYTPDLPWELYRISDDIGETSNVIEEYPEVADRLLREWTEWSDGLIMPQWGWQPDLCGSVKSDIR